MSSIGIFPGTFDPLHEGHIAFARAARVQCHLDMIVFLPEPLPRKKVAVRPVEERVKYIYKKIASFKELEVKLLTSPQFSVKDTLPEISDITAGADVTLLLGTDVLSTLHTWNNLALLLTKCSVAIGIRGATTEEDVRNAIAHVEQKCGLAINYTTIRTDFSLLASSALRK